VVYAQNYEENDSLRPCSGASVPTEFRRGQFPLSVILGPLGREWIPDLGPREQAESAEYQRHREHSETGSESLS